MEKNSSGHDYGNNADGFEILGGIIIRKLTLTGGDLNLNGGGSALITFPTSTSTLATLALSESLQNKTLDNTNILTLRDDRFTLQDNADTSKQLIFQLSGITTATTRTITAPNASGEMIVGGFVSTSDATSHTLTLSNGTTIQFVEGSNITLTTTGTGSNAILTIASTGGGGGIPGGADTQLQFNDGGVFGGDAGLTYNKTTNNLSIGNFLGVGKVNDGTATIELKSFTAGSIQGLRIEADNAANTQFSSFVTADGFTRFSFLADGTLKWGSGAVVADTNLYRSAADVLTTDDKFEARGGLRISTISAIGQIWTATDVLGNGSWQNNTVGGSSVNFEREAADVVYNSATASTAANLEANTNCTVVWTYALPPNTMIAVEALLAITTAATTTGAVIGVNMTTGASGVQSMLNARVFLPVTNTAAATEVVRHNWINSTTNNSTVGVAILNTGSTTTQGAAVNFTAVNRGSTNTILRIVVGSEVGSSAVTVKADSIVTFNTATVV